MRPLLTRATALTLLMVCSGCLEADAELQASGEEIVSLPDLDLDRSDFNETAEWIAYEVDPAPTQPLIMASVRQWDWPHEVAPAAQPSCAITSLNGTGPANVVTMPNDVSGSGLGAPSELDLGARALGQGAHVRVINLGSSVGLALFEVSSLGPKEPAVALVGIDKPSHWMAHDTTFDVNASFGGLNWRQIDSGTWSCQTGLDSLDGGTYVETPAGLFAEGMTADVQVADGLAWWIGIQADLRYQFSITSPSGTVYSVAPENVTIFRGMHQYVMCGSEAGSWRFELLELRASNSKSGDIRMASMDAVPAVQRAFRCLGEQALVEIPAPEAII